MIIERRGIIWIVLDFYHNEEDATYTFMYFIVRRNGDIDLSIKTNDNFSIFDKFISLDKKVFFASY